MNKIFYVGPINSKMISNNTGLKLQVGAAARKVFGVLNAAGIQKVDPFLVTTPIIGAQGISTTFAKEEFIEEGINVVQLLSVGSPLLNRVIASFNYLTYLVKHYNKNNIVLFYNFYPEYIPAAFFLSLRGNQAFIDIEDLPLKNWKPREIVSQISYRIMRILCRKSVVAASTKILELAKAEDGHVVHGSLNQDENRYTAIHFDNTIRILYGGSITKGTGSELFAKSIDELRKSYKESSPNIEFIVTGFGETDSLTYLSDKKHEKINVEIKTNLSPDEYRQTMKNCHVSLCLKLPNSVYGDTTFPSKVVEICANSLVLISTKVSDVESVYKGAAILLDEATPECLCEEIKKLAENPSMISDVAQKGHQRTVDTYSPEIVGEKLVTFFKKHQKGFGTNEN